MMLMCGTVLVLTAETRRAPFLIRPAFSVFVPTMKPVTLCKNTMGTLLYAKVSDFHRNDGNKIDKLGRER